MTAKTIARALGGHRVGRGWMACCPAHNDTTPSLALQDSNTGKLLVCCHAGCDQARVISALRSMGLWPDNNFRLLSQVVPTNVIERMELDHDEAKRTEAALKLWQYAMPSRGTLVETYFQSRALRVSPPPTIRFCPDLKHPSGASWPAMIALVTRGPTNLPVAIHRTYLARDGIGKAPIKPQKMMFGPCRGGAVRLADPGEALMVGEGIETCLSVMEYTGKPAWAALSTSGLRTLDLSADVLDVTVLADGDDPGEAAALDCARRWKREGRRVRIARPPQGMDFNDLMLSRLHLRKETCNE